MRIVATLKPGAGTGTKIEQMIPLGIGAFRVNFGRRSLADNVALVATLCRTRARDGAPCAVFVDLPGSKARLELSPGTTAQLVAGETVDLVAAGAVAADPPRSLAVPASLLDRLRVGDALSLCDSRSGVVVESFAGGRAVCRVVEGGEVYNAGGVAVESRYSANLALSELDLAVMQAVGSEDAVICPSFCDSPALVDAVRVRSARPETRIVAKIESPEAIRNLDAIAARADGLMLGRGDLSTFLSPTEIRELAGRMRDVASEHRCLLVLATDYFKSMVDGGALSREGIADLEHARALRPDYLVVNETSYSSAWRAIAAKAAAYQDRR